MSDTHHTSLSTLSLHDALPISYASLNHARYWTNTVTEVVAGDAARVDYHRVQRESPRAYHVAATETHQGRDRDRKSTRLNSSHTVISYAVFCLKKKNIATLSSE